MEVNDIQFRHPCFIYIIGKSEAGKTFFINHVVDDAMKKKFKVVYIVNKAFPVEEEIDEKCEKNKNVFIIQTSNLEQPTMDFITKSMTSDKKKLLIFDNFTFGLTLPFLDFTTFSRKYNASVVFIGHSLYSSKTISPRLRELVSYFVLFYLPDVDAIKRILTKKQIELFEEHIKFRSFKFLLIDNANSTYLISKIPEFRPTLIWDKKKDKKEKKPKGFE